MTEPLNIYLWLEDFDDNSLPEYDREEQLREAVLEYNYKYSTKYKPESTVRQYLRIQRDIKFGEE